MDYLKYGGWRVKKVVFLAVCTLLLDRGKGDSLLIPNTYNGSSAAVLLNWKKTSETVAKHVCKQK